MVLPATVLVSPHFYVYDLLIVVPAGFLLTNWLMREPAVAYRSTLSTCLVLLYVAPLAGAVMAKTIHVQPTTVIVCVLAAVIAWHASQRSGRGSLPRRSL